MKVIIDNIPHYNHTCYFGDGSQCRFISLEKSCLLFIEPIKQTGWRYYKCIQCYNKTTNPLTADIREIEKKIQLT